MRQWYRRYHLDCRSQIPCTRPVWRSAQKLVLEESSYSSLKIFFFFWQPSGIVQCFFRCYHTILRKPRHPSFVLLHVSRGRVQSVKVPTPGVNQSFAFHIPSSFFPSGTTAATWLGKAANCGLLSLIPTMPHCPSNRRFHVRRTPMKVSDTRDFARKMWV